MLLGLTVADATSGNVGADTLEMEKLGIIQQGTVLAADNVIYPGAPDFLDHVQQVHMHSTMSYGIPVPSC